LKFGTDITSGKLYFLPIIVAIETGMIEIVFLWKPTNIFSIREKERCMKLINAFETSQAFPIHQFLSYVHAT